jgi:phenylpropionate dioxygenase-like ring-hydroxylating dioxygenase large terminal subunit
MFVRNCWYVAAWDFDVPVGRPYALTIADEAVVLFRTENGGIAALEDRCCHRFAPLSMGRVEDGCYLRCMYHGLKFDANGMCIEIPGQDKIPATARVRAFPAVERHSWVWLWMGDPDKADDSLIPEAVGFDDPEYVLRAGHIDYQAYYQLINDNLTDFSHLSYVHANSFGATDAWANSRPHVRRIDRGIRVSRWLLQKDAMREGKAAGMKGTDGALWQTYDFLAPGILLMYSATYSAEMMPADGVSPPEGEPISANFTSQAVTPMRGNTARYFYSWGPRRKDGGEEMADQMFAVAQMAFAEDREIIEAQQRVIDLKPGVEVLTSADVGPVQMRSVIRQLFRAENQEDPQAEVEAALQPVI